MLNTDKAPTYAAAIAEFKAEGKCPDETRHRQVKSLNNVVEADHGKLKLLLRPVLLDHHTPSSGLQQSPHT